MKCITIIAPLFCRVVSSDVKAAEGVYRLMQRFNWTRIAVITQQETIFTSVSTSDYGADIFNFNIVAIDTQYAPHTYVHIGTSQNSVIFT